MDATIALPTTADRPRPGASSDVGSHHARRAWAFAAAMALATAVLTAIAGGVIGGTPAGGPGACVPRPVPGGDWAAAECVAQPLPGADIGPIMPR